MLVGERSVASDRGRADSSWKCRACHPVTGRRRRRGRREVGQATGCYTFSHDRGPRALQGATGSGAGDRELYIFAPRRGPDLVPAPQAPTPSPPPGRRTGGGATVINSRVGGRRGGLAAPFPSAPLRTGRASFQASGSPVAGLSTAPSEWAASTADTTIAEPHSRHLTSRSGLPSRSACPPSPRGRLSRPPTTMGAPSPWGSRPTGDLVLP